MLRHYFNIAARSLLKHKTFSIINLFGLAVGLSCCMLIAVYITHELSYDKFHQDADRIYRVTYQINANGQSFHLAVTPNIISPVLQREFPEIENGVRLYPRTQVIKNGDKVFDENGFLYADSTFFEIFSFNALEGDLTNALKDPQSLILTASMAEKYFGDEHAVNQTLLLGSNQTPFVVKAVIEDAPANSHIDFNFIAPFHYLKWATKEQFGSANYYTYVMLKEGTTGKQVEDKIPALIEKMAGPEARESMAFYLQPLLDVHLYSDEIQADSAITGDLTYLYLFAAIGFLILLIACVNYMNLATSRSIDRAKEIGLRKVVGAQWKQLFAQFMGEASLISSLALIVALALVYIELPYFNELTERNVQLADFLTLNSLLIMIGVIVLVTFLAGGYPAFVFANFQPIKVLRGAYKNSGSGVWLRKGLVVFQFTISVILITATLVIQNQLQFMQDKKLGYEKDHLIVMPNGLAADKVESFKSSLKSHPQILYATSCTESPVNIKGGYSLWAGHVDESPNSNMVTAMAVDPDFVETMGLQIVEGTDYTPSSHESEERLFMLNETAVEMMGWTIDEAVGQKVNLNGRKGRIHAVVNDFHIAPLHRKIEPLVLFLEARQIHQLMVRVAPEDITQTLGFIETQWQEWMPNRPFTYQFVDEQFDQLYKSEERLGQLFSAFAFLAILIACLGLFGLASYTAVQRNKEMGIRKVLGASVSQLVMMLSKDFSILVAIAFVIATPLAWLGMVKWLEGFAYKVPLGLGTFVLAGVIVLLIAWLTTAQQAFKAASTNPIEALRDE